MMKNQESFSQTITEPTRKTKEARITRANTKKGKL